MPFELGGHFQGKSSKRRSKAPVGLWLMLLQHPLRCVSDWCFMPEIQRQWSLINRFKKMCAKLKFFLQQKMVCSRHISGPWQVATGQRNHCPVTVTSLLRQNAPLQTTAVCWGSVGNPAAYHDWGWFYNVLICFIQPITILILGMVYYLLYPDILMVYHPSFSSNMAIQGEFPIFAHTHTMIFFPVDTLMPPILRYATSLRYSYSI